MSLVKQNADDNAPFASKVIGLFVAGVPFGYFGVELSFGAGRTSRVITEEGPSFHWPWIQVMLVSQRIVSATNTLTFRSAYGIPVRVRYTVQFRACPDIRDNEDQNVFIVKALNDPNLNNIKSYIHQHLDIQFGWACRRASADDLLNSESALELFGCCLLKLPEPPNEDAVFIGSHSLDDSETIRFYNSNRGRILGSYPEHRLRPICSIIPGAANSGRYCGQCLGLDGRIANPEFHSEISEVERLLGIEVLDFRVEYVDFRVPTHWNIHSRLS
jgi:regulator of protease activity HflC (stomatin/prohibitin superfamily)